jgi:phospho-N-acetylmuramoyl-pentapeptide-transferase
VIDVNAINVSPRIFDLVTVVVAFALSIAAYPLLIKGLRRIRMGQVIQQELSDSHQRKAGTPTGGGVLFVLFGAVGGAISLGNHRGALPVTLALVLFGLLGMFDDAAKLHIGQIGIPARLKLPIQVLLAIPIAWLVHTSQHLLPDAFYWPVAILAIVGTANGVNFNDGLDGLAGGQSVIALMAIAFLVPGVSAGGKAVAMTLVGALLAFLVFNRYPARIFMGDTGSLALGAALATMALQQGWAILLVLVGLVFVAEVLSVILQVAYFKSTGRRLFRMAPIHHTFQIGGWSERRIVRTFWVVGVMAAGVSGLAARAMR